MTRIYKELAGFEHKGIEEMRNNWLLYVDEGQQDGFSEGIFGIRKAKLKDAPKIYGSCFIWTKWFYACSV